MIASGCHRLGTGIALMYLLDKKMLNQLIYETKNKKSISEVEDSNFEMIIEVQTETGRIPCTQDITLKEIRSII